MIDDDVVGFCGILVILFGVWYIFVGDGGIYIVFVCDVVDFDIKFSVYLGICDVLVCVDGNDDDFVNCLNFISQVENFLIVDGEIYYILVYVFGGEIGNFDLIFICCVFLVVVCQDFEFIVNNVDLIVIILDDIDDGSIVDCGGLVLFLDCIEFDCLDDGENVVILIVIDMFGNIDQCEVIVMIVNIFVVIEVGCIVDVNVILGEECFVCIILFMVFIGNNLECVVNIEIIVDGGDFDVINGCGEYIYVVEIFELVEVIIEFCV